MPARCSSPSSRTKNSPVETSRQSPSNTSPAMMRNAARLSIVSLTSASTAARLAAREPRRDRGILERRGGERAVDMQIGGMDEMESHAARLAGIGGQRNWRGRSAHRREAEPLEERACREFVGFT